MKKYKVILADPPWIFNNKNTGGSMSSGSEAQYRVMTVQDICNMPIPDICQKDCVLFMWWVASQPEEALRVMRAWGFQLKTMTGFTWVKQTKNGKPDFGMGFWTRQGSESCLIAVKGKPKRISAGVRTVIEHADDTAYHMRLRHSQKPDIFRDRVVELMGKCNRVELFARGEAGKGWDVFGDEVENSIILP